MTEETQDRPAVLTVEEVAKLLRLGRTATYEAIRRGEIPSIKIGRKRLVATAVIDRMLLGE
jgi:excisionase family DNA binding protein